MDKYVEENVGQHTTKDEMKDDDSMVHDILKNTYEIQQRMMLATSQIQEMQKTLSEMQVKVQQMERCTQPNTYKPNGYLCTVRDQAGHMVGKIFRAEKGYVFTKYEKSYIKPFDNIDIQYEIRSNNYTVEIEGIRGENIEHLLRELQRVGNELRRFTF